MPNAAGSFVGIDRDPATETIVCYSDKVQTAMESSRLGCGGERERGVELATCWGMHPFVSSVRG